MAWGSGNVEICKKNSKFESFLKRTLSEEAVDRVRAYESCIVVSEKENKAFKFVALSDERIYLTENPPKTLQEALHLKDVISVELVNEFPDFLTGQERDNTQHIAITYWSTELGSKRRSLRRSRRSPRGSLTEIPGDRSNTSTPLGYASSVDSYADDTGYSTHGSHSLNQSRPTSRGSAKPGIQAKKKKKPTGLNDSWDHDSILRSLKEEIEEDMLEDIEEDRLSVIRSIGGSKGHAVLQPRNSIESIGNIRSLNYGIRDRKLPVPGGVDDSNSVRSLSQQSVRPLPPMPKTGAFEKPGLGNSLPRKDFLVAENATEKKSSKAGRCCFFFRCCVGQKNQVTPINKNAANHKQKDQVTNGQPDKLQQMNGNNSYSSAQLAGQLRELVGPPPPSRGSSYGGGLGSRSGTPLFDGERSINELNVSTSDLGRSSSFIGLSSLSVDGTIERRKCVLNIYLLNLTSPLLMLLKSAWKNYIFRSTLALEPEQIRITSDPIPNSSSTRETGWRDKLERKHSRLKRDMMQSDLSMEQLYLLVDQLLTDAQSNFTVKKLFWKTPDIFHFLVCQLQRYLPKSSANLSTEEGKAQRADELEYVIHVLTCINLMLRESEILPSRLLCIRLENGKVIFDLLKLLMHQPDVPYRPLTLTKHWSAPLAASKVEDKEKNLDEELAKLKMEFTKTAIASVFEIFLVAKQAPSDESSCVTVTEMVKCFNDCKITEKFVDRLLSQIMELVSLSRFDYLSPVQAMQAHHMFSLLLTFLLQSKAVAVHVRNHYYEEFKYFIQAPAVSRKLPVQFPITAATISIIDQVVALVLNNQNAKANKVT